MTADPTHHPAAGRPLPHRVLHSRGLLLALVLVATGASLLALQVQDDALDTALGAVTGATVVLALFVVVVQVLGARARREALADRDRRGLDGLEPLRAARRDSAGEQPR